MNDAEVDQTGIAPGRDLLSAAFDSASEAGRERVRLATRNFGIAFFESDLALGRVLLSPNGFAMFGLPVPDPPELDRGAFWALYHPDDIAAARARFAADLDGARGRDDYQERVRILRADGGGLRWIEFSGHMFGPPGGRTHIVGMLRDVTEAVLAEERRALLAREVEHRANNLLAVVQALVRLTRGPTLEEYRGSLEGRILALARTQSLAGACDGAGRSVAFAGLVEGELAAYGDHVRTSLASAPPLARVSVQPVAMILHELATNAAKHGALSCPEGEVGIALGTEGDAVVLRWTETGGPPIAGPPRGSGTGMGVVRSQARRLDAALELAWPDQGLCLALRVPLRRWTQG